MKGREKKHKRDEVKKGEKNEVASEEHEEDKMMKEEHKKEEIRIEWDRRKLERNETKKIMK